MPFQNPAVSDWSPRKGPCSGGTLVVVSGSDLHYGSTVRVMMNNRLPAPVVWLISESVCTVFRSVLSFHW